MSLVVLSEQSTSIYTVRKNRQKKPEFPGQVSCSEN